MYKKLKFDHTNKWYMHDPESVPENETHELHWDLGIQTDHLIAARLLDIEIVDKKENLPNCRLYCPSWPQSKIERKQKERWIPGPCLRIEKTEEHKSDRDTNCNRCSWNSYQTIGKRTGGPSEQQDYWARPEYWEESWRLEETCRHSNSSDKPSASTSVKKSQKR